MHKENSLIFITKMVLVFSMFLTVSNADTAKYKTSLLCLKNYEKNIKILKSEDQLVTSIERTLVENFLDYRKVYYLYERYLKRVTSAMRSAISDYKGTAYGSINSYLRGETLPLTSKELKVLEKTIKLIDKAIDLAPEVPQNIVLFRGIATTKDIFSKLKKGDNFTDKAFASTSLSFRTAFKFANNYKLNSYPILQIIHIKSSKVRGLYIENDSNFFETEILLDKNTTFKVLKTQKVYILGETIYFPPSLPGNLSPMPIDPIPSMTMPGMGSVGEFPTGINIPIFVEKNPNQLELFPEEPHLPPSDDFYSLPSDPLQSSYFPTKFIIQHLEVIQD